MEHGEVERNRHSRMGISSLVLGVVAIVALVLIFVLGPAFLSSKLGGVNPQDLKPQNINQDSPVVVVAMVIGFGFLLSVLLTLVGFGLGIAGLVQRRRRKLFAAVGTALNGFVVLGVIALVVLSFAIAGNA